jgi:hypothetical protein
MDAEVDEDVPQLAVNWKYVSWVSVPVVKVVVVPITVHDPARPVGEDSHE